MFQWTTRRLHGGFKISFIGKIIIIFFKSDYFVCQQWCQHLFSRTRSGMILNCSSFLNSTFINLFTSYQLHWILIVTRIHQSYSIPREHPGWWIFTNNPCTSTVTYPSHSVTISNFHQISILSRNDQHIFFWFYGCRRLLQWTIGGWTEPTAENTPDILNSTELLGAHALEIITISSVASLEPKIVTIESNSNDPNISCGYGRQGPIHPSRLKELNLPANPFNILATMAVVKPTARRRD